MYAADPRAACLIVAVRFCDSPARLRLTGPSALGPLMRRSLDCRAMDSTEAKDILTRELAKDGQENGSGLAITYGRSVGPLKVRLAQHADDVDAGLYPHYS